MLNVLLWILHLLSSDITAILCVILQVAGIKGMFLANKRIDNQIKTHITYNRGRDWRLLQAPSKDLGGNNIHCLLVSISVCCRFMCVTSVHQREALTGVDWLQQQWEAELRKRSSLRLLSWKVSHFDSVQWAEFSFKKHREKEVSNRKAESFSKPLKVESSWGEVSV